MKILIRNALKMSLNVNQAFSSPEMPSINALSGINVEYKHFIQGALKLLSWEMFIVTGKVRDLLRARI